MQKIVIPIDLVNIQDHSTPLKEWIYNWLFTNDDGQLPSSEHQDQIFPLTKEAAFFLWNTESNLKIFANSEHFKNIKCFNSKYSNQQEIKKFLNNLGILFKHRVFKAMQPDMGLALTWKMVIKYSNKLFWANDQTIWDKSLNWKLEYHHDGEFTFGKDLLRARMH